MKKIAFDSEKYLNLQRDHILERINQFEGKLYMEFGGKMLEDFHAARVLPGYEPDNKIRLLKELKDQVEIVIAINANNIEHSKARGDLGISYDQEVVFENPENVEISHLIYEALAKEAGITLSTRCSSDLAFWAA